MAVILYSGKKKLIVTILVNTILTCNQNFCHCLALQPDFTNNVNISSAHLFYSLAVVYIYLDCEDIDKPSPGELCHKVAKCLQGICKVTRYTLKMSYVPFSQLF